VGSPVDCESLKAFYRVTDAAVAIQKLHLISDTRSDAVGWRLKRKKRANCK
jgi:hypothetical protein